MDVSQPTAPPLKLLPKHVMELVPNLSPSVRRAIALKDLRDGVAMYRLSCTLGWLDIKLRYRGSILGPFWLTLSTGIMVLSMGILYSQLFHMELHDYMPYLALSLVLWNALSGIVTDACLCFTTAEGTIRSVRLPFTVYAARAVVRNILVLAHNVIVILCVFAWYGTWPGVAAFGTLAGLALWLLDAVAACLLLGALCARFRDIPPIVGSIVQIAFFLTPIIWRPELIGAAAGWLVLNPFYPLLALVRDPLLNEIPSREVWIAGFVWSGLLCTLSGLLFARVRARLAFWV
jgi:lipopolysaccharide transport system permease protein